MPQLHNQIAVITGAGRGIGHAIALKFAAAGADIVCVSRTAENAEKVAVEVRALGRRAWAYGVDVAVPAEVICAVPYNPLPKLQSVDKALQNLTVPEVTVPGFVTVAVSVTIVPAAT